MLSPALVAELFPSDLPNPEHWENFYPPRQLKDGAIVTRFGPSPTGFLHTGGIYVAAMGKDLAQKSGGVYFVRIEDTDLTREVPGAREQFARAFEYFQIESDESDSNSRWGPYEQSRRATIYQTYARELLLRGLAYPCFCSREQLAEVAAQQERAKAGGGYYGQWARCRSLSTSEVEERLRAGEPYTIRFRSPDGDPGMVAYDDLIRGRIVQQDNRNDIVILKSSDQALRLPTYHFAHAVDDHLMRVNVVLRAEEWIPSVPLHLQLFNALGFDQIPYAHIAPLMKMEGTSRRKLSKRKDPEANVDFYLSEGYPAGAVLHYLRGLANSRLAELDFDEAMATGIRLSDCGVTGPLFDLVKLGSISKDYIARTAVTDVVRQLGSWAERYDPALLTILRENEQLVRDLLEAERNTTRPRKDIAKWSDFERVYGFYFADLFQPVVDAADIRFAPVDPNKVRELAAAFASDYRSTEDAEAWFEQIRQLAVAKGFAATMPEFKAAPQQFAGSIRDVSTVLRVLIAGATQSPDLFGIARLLGRDEVLRRVRAVL